MNTETTFTIEEKAGGRTVRATFKKEIDPTKLQEHTLALLNREAVSWGGGELDGDDDETGDGEDAAVIDIPDPDKPAMTKTYMQAEQVEGSRGQEVDVHVYGGTIDEMSGYSFAMGYGHWLKVVSIEHGEFFKRATGWRRPDGVSLTKGEKGYFFATSEDIAGGWPEPFVRVMFVFAGIDPNAPKGILAVPAPIQVPEKTVLATVRFKIPDTPHNINQTLLLKRHWFKEKASDPGLLRVDSMYASRKVRGGLAPVLISGKVTVAAIESAPAAVGAAPIAVGPPRIPGGQTELR